MTGVIYLSPRFSSGEITAQDLEDTTSSPEEQLRTAIQLNGMEPPDQIILDGKIHRFRPSRKPGKTGWYVAFSDGIPAGAFGDWRENLEVKWRAGTKRNLTPAEEMAFSARMREAKRLRDELREQERIAVANAVYDIWEQAPDASPEHPYLARKCVKPHGTRIGPDGRLILPMLDDEGDILSIQYIDHAGTKRFHTGGKTGGTHYLIGEMNSSILYIAEGFATAATIHEVSGHPCLVAYNAGNLKAVAAYAQSHYPEKKIILVADNDESGTGQRAAEDVRISLGISYILPPITGDANDYHLAGHNLAQLLEPLPKDEWLIQADEFSSQPAPIRWLVRSWLPRNSMIMVHGPSGGGKSFLVLDWCMTMSAGIEEWAGHKVRSANVVYLAGEGHHGMRARVAAWKAHHEVKSLSMWVSSAGCDLNTPEGYSKALSSIKALNQPVNLIVIDTLHRFLAGDENSAQDTKTMLDASGALMRECDCSVAFIHHTGVSEEAQHRARGSSAWRGALDIEISVIPATDDQPIQVVQRKSKDSELAEPIWVQLEKVPVPGWMDEDEQQVYSAVIKPVDYDPEGAKLESQLTAHCMLFESAWFSSGAKDNAGLPCITRDQLRNYLIVDCQKKESTVANMIKPSAKGKPICNLMTAGIITQTAHGWAVSDPEFSVSLIRKRDQKPRF